VSSSAWGRIRGVKLPVSFRGSRVRGVLVGRPGQPAARPGRCAHLARASLPAAATRPPSTPPPGSWSSWPGTWPPAARTTPSPAAAWSPASGASSRWPPGRAARATAPDGITSRRERRLGSQGLAGRKTPTGTRKQDLVIGW